MGHFRWIGLLGARTCHNHSFRESKIVWSELHVLIADDAEALVSGRRRSRKLRHSSLVTSRQIQLAVPFAQETCVLLKTSSCFFASISLPFLLQAIAGDIGLGHRLPSLHTLFAPVVSPSCGGGSFSQTRPTGHNDHSLALARWRLLK
jgi:hypothetical protein